MSEVRTKIPSVVSSAARPPERTAAAGLHLSAHRRVLDLQGGGRRAMMLVGLAEHNQPQRESEPDLVPLLPHSPQTSSCHPARSTACPSVVCLCLRRLSLAAAPPPLPPPPNTPARHTGFRLRILSALNNDRLAFPNHSHARDNNPRTDSWSRTQLHIFARTVYLVKRRYTTCPSHNPTSTPPK
jgi:hypothetical protein